MPYAVACSFLFVHAQQTNVFRPHRTIAVYSGRRRWNAGQFSISANSRDHQRWTACNWPAARATNSVARVSNAGHQHIHDALHCIGEGLAAAGIQVRRGGGQGVSMDLSTVARLAEFGD